MHEQFCSDPAIYIVSDRSTGALRTQDWKKNQISSSFFLHWESKVQILVCVTNSHWSWTACLECDTKWISKSYHFLKEETRANYKYWDIKRRWVMYGTWYVLLPGKQTQRAWRLSTNKWQGRVTVSSLQSTQCQKTCGEANEKGKTKPD